MQSPARPRVHLAPNSSKRPWAGVCNWILTHPVSRLSIPPLVLIGLVAALITPLLTDLNKLSGDDLVRVPQVHPPGPHDGNLIVNIKNINPNNGIATLDVTYVTDDLDKGNIELWIASGGVTHVDGQLTYDVDTEMHRVPIVMDSPSIFVWGQTRRATYKEHDVDIKIDNRTPGYLYPFDHYDVEFSLAVIDKAQNTLYPTLWFELEDPRYVNETPHELVSHGHRSVIIPNSIAVVLDRPMYQRIFLGLSMLVGLGCVVWSLYKITYTEVDGMEALSLLAFDMTVLLAVPALRGVFVPSNLQFAPLFDFFVVLIWTAGLLALVVNVVRHDVMIRIRQWASNGAQADRALFVSRSDDRQNEWTGNVPRRVAG
jgi:hypothetical protein